MHISYKNNIIRSYYGIIPKKYNMKVKTIDTVLKIEIIKIYEKETKKSEMLKEIFSKSLKEASKKIKEEENESRDSIWFTDVQMEAIGNTTIL